NSSGLLSHRAYNSHTMASSARMKILRAPPVLYTRSHVDSGFSTTPNCDAAMGSRNRSGRSMLRSSMERLFGFDGVGEEHGVDLVLERLRFIAICPCTRQTIDLRLHLSRMRAHQEDATADLNRFRNGVRNEQHREMRIVPKLEQLILHLAAR